MEQLQELVQFDCPGWIQCAVTEAEGVEAALAPSTESLSEYVSDPCEDAIGPKPVRQPQYAILMLGRVVVVADEDPWSNYRFQNSLILTPLE
jgi:hypothetical protein